MTARHALLASTLVAGALAGCAVQGPFPSLALRPEEAEVSLAEPVRPPVAVARDVAIRDRVAALRARAEGGARAFDAAYAAAERATRSVGASGSESWVSAQQAVSRLEAARGEAAAALAELDRLSVERADLPTNADDYALIGAAMVEIEAGVSERQARLDALRSRLNP